MNPTIFSLGALVDQLRWQKHKINTQNDGRDDILNLVDPPRWKKPKKNYYDSRSL